MIEMEEKNVIANPLIVLREEFDDWAILFDPDTGNTFGINPIGVLIWKQLDGRHAVTDIIGKIKEAAVDTPADVAGHVQAFIQNALRFGLVRYESDRG
jgi:SynChlorMet cassette protein ScmD